MNKKFLTTLILLTFCATPICWAGEIIVGVDGQARYANEVEAKNISEMQKVQEKDVNVELNEGGAMTVSLEEIDKIESPYKSKNMKYINSDPNQIDVEKSLKEAGLWKKTSKSDIRGYCLQNNGDYIKYRAGKKYAVEYHNDKSLMGIVRVNKVNKKTLVCHEYRTNDTKTAALAHVMISYELGENSYAVFVYRASGELRCLQYKDKLYVKDLSDVPRDSESLFRNTKSSGEQNAKHLEDGVRCVVFLPLILPAAAVVAVLGLPFVLLSPILSPLSLDKTH